MFGDFDDYEDMEFFCLNVLGDSDKISGIKYIIYNLNSIIVILESEFEKNELTEELQNLLENPNVNFYFIFDRKHLFMVNLSDKIKDIIFKPAKDFMKKVDIEDMDINSNVVYDLDELLEKIEKYGVNSLTNEEKKYLDNFGI